MQDDIAIRVDHVSKDFRLPHERVGSIKSIFTHLFSYISHHRQYETQHALRDVSLEIKKGEFFGIVGRNGSGKSTLLKMLAGIYQPTHGRIHINGRLVPFIELGVGFSPELTGKQNVYLNGALLGFSKKEIDAQYDDIVDFAELAPFMDQKLKNYSSGMQVRLAFSMAIRAQADILLIDEVLAVGDADFQRKCFEYFKTLKKNKKTVVFVSHDMNAIREFCDQAALIDESVVKSIGATTKISNQYSQLFINEAIFDQVEVTESQGERWGNGDVRLIKASARVTEGEVKVATTIKVNKPVGKLIYGIHINSLDGSEITAMNNGMLKQPSIKNLEAGQELEFTWNILNIFNDGKYTVTLTFIDDASNTLEWVTEAADFTVRRPQRSTTAVLPPVSVQYKVHQ